ncbi:hypothetical protein Pla52o_36790 [Novipirellula galeiformis]|uniref:Uncharacterized protein n=1 Tax=Novipirellula galeiformis TaxID=2528004 RepID=A0A5C6CBM9_9BACT|nr:hypothetical protein Pla52o_36790 [Novipirellula galeiformis]
MGSSQYSILTDESWISDVPSAEKTRFDMIIPYWGTNTDDAGCVYQGISDGRNASIQAFYQASNIDERYEN